MEQPPIPAYPGPAYPPGPPPPRIHPRVQTIGILNIIFGVLSLGCATIGGISLAAFGEQTRDIFGTDLPVYFDAYNALCVNGLTFVILLAGGILLLRRRSLGRTLTLVAGIAIPIMALLYGVAVVVLFTAVDVPSRYRQALEQMRLATLAGACLGTVLRMAYPIVAAIIIGRKPEELGLS